MSVSSVLNLSLEKLATFIVPARESWLHLLWAFLTNCHNLVCYFFRFKHFRWISSKLCLLEMFSKAHLMVLVHFLICKYSYHKTLCYLCWYCEQRSWDWITMASCNIGATCSGSVGGLKAAFEPSLNKAKWLEQLCRAMDSHSQNKMHISFAQSLPFISPFPSCLFPLATQKHDLIPTTFIVPAKGSYRP